MAIVICEDYNSNYNLPLVEVKADANKLVANVYRLLHY